MGGPLWDDEDETKLLVELEDEQQLLEPDDEQQLLELEEEQQLLELDDEQELLELDDEDGLLQLDEELKLDDWLETSDEPLGDDDGLDDDRVDDGDADEGLEDGRLDDGEPDEVGPTLDDEKRLLLENDMTHSLFVEVYDCRDKKSSCSSRSAARKSSWGKPLASRKK